MIFNSHSKMSARELADELNGYEYDPEDTREVFGEIIAAMIILCNRVTELETKLEALQKGQTFEERMKADIAKLEAARIAILQDMQKDQPTATYNGLSAQHNLLAIQIHEIKTMLVRLGALPKSALEE